MKKNIKSLIQYSISQYHSLKPVSSQEQLIEDESMFFVTGYDKSGTTWIMKAINEVEQFGCVGSTQYFDFLKNGSPESNILKVIKNNHHRETIFNISSENFSKFFIAEFKSKIIHLLGKNRKFYGEKSTAQDPELIHFFFPKSRMIFLVRDMRDIIVSFAFHFDRRYKNRLQNWTPENSKFNEDGTIKDDFVERELSNLNSYYNHIIELSTDVQSNIKFIKYEDLISTNGFDYFVEILSFISPTPIEREKASIAWENNSFEILSKGRKPGEKDANSFFRSGQSGDYVNHLTPEQIHFIEDRLQSPLKNFGYL